MLRSKIVLGTVQLGLDYGINNKLGKPSKNSAFEILDAAYHNGITTLDTANAYGDAIQVISNYHSDRGSVFNIISKFHLTDKNISNECRKEVQTLKVANLDSYLFHSFNDFYSCSKELLQSIKKLKKEGLINSIGVSVYSNEQFLTVINHPDIDVIQFPFNLLDNVNKKGDLIKLAKLKGKSLHVRSVFLQGLFFHEINKLPANLQKLESELKQIHEIVKQHKITMQELCLSYVLSNKNIDKVLIGVDSVAQLNSNIESIVKIEEQSLSFDELINQIDVKNIDLLNPVNW